MDGYAVAVFLGGAACPGSLPSARRSWDALRRFCPARALPGGDGGGGSYFSIQLAATTPFSVPGDWPWSAVMMRLLLAR